MTQAECVRALEEGSVVYYEKHPYLILAVALRRRVTRGADFFHTVEGPCFVRCELLQMRGGHSIHVGCEDITLTDERGTGSAPGK